MLSLKYKNGFENEHMIDQNNGDAILIAQYFPPFNLVASQRAARIARVLLKNFDNVHVITLPVENIAEQFIDKEFDSDILFNERIKIIKASPLLKGYGFVKTHFTLHRVIGACLSRLFCSTGIDWIPSMHTALKAICNEANVRLIVTSGDPFIPFYSITRFANKAAIPCIIDYRDLWSQNPRAPYLSFPRFIIRNFVEAYANKKCSLITTVSEGCRRSILWLNPLLEVRVVMNTPDQAYVKWFRDLEVQNSFSSFDRGDLNIVLAGTVYPECTPRLLARAIKLLPAGLQNRVKLHYFGMNADLVKAEFTAIGLTKSIVTYGLVKKTDAVRAVKSADILLSLIYDSITKKITRAVYGVMTTKIFDYFLSGKPIISIGPPDTDVNKLAADIGYGDFRSFDATQERELSSYLIDAFADLNSFRRRKSNALLPDFSGMFEQIILDVMKHK